MAVSASVQEFLRRANVAYTVFPHRRAETAQEEAAVSHIPGRDWAKVVVCFADGRPIQAVVPADLHVDLERLAELADANHVRLATENELEWLYPDCEPGANPPFATLYRQPVFVDVTLSVDQQVVFNGGTHGDAIAMSFDDFVRLARPTIGRFATSAIRS